MTLPLLLASGKEAHLVTLDDDRITLVSEQAFAPGSRVAATALGRTLRFKVHRSVRVDDGFTIEGRPLDLTREARETFTAALVASG
jgi:hypothetical protein